MVKKKECCHYQAKSYVILVPLHCRHLVVCGYSSVSFNRVYLPQVSAKYDTRVLIIFRSEHCPWPWFGLFSVFVLLLWT